MCRTAAPLGAAGTVAGALMLIVDLDLPPGALLAPPAPDATDLAQKAGALWFTAERPDCQVSDGRVRQLQARGRDLVALPVEGNDLNCRHVVSGGGEYLSLTARTACGFSTELGDIAPCLGLFVIFSAPDGPAQTLAAVVAHGSRDYLFLNHDDGALTLGRRNADTAASVPVPAAARRPVLALARVDQTGLALSVDDGPIVEVPDPEALQDGAHTGFIGCRRQRAGLLKSLGAGHIYDVGFMPDTDPFSAGLADFKAALTARAKGHGAHGV